LWFAEVVTPCLTNAGSHPFSSPEASLIEHVLAIPATFSPRLTLSGLQEIWTVSRLSRLIVIAHKKAMPTPSHTAIDVGYVGSCRAMHMMPAGGILWLCVLGLREGRGWPQKGRLHQSFHAVYAGWS
jgi:hypothetical protein